MRASRLIAMLMALQHHGRMTSTQLAAQLEVSIRTVLRDVESLSEAGVPIYAVPGSGGGIELIDGFDTRLNGLTPDAVQALLLAGQPALAETLGLAVAARSARRTLVGALPPALAEAAVELDRWFLHDPVGRGTPDGDLPRRLTRAIRLQVEVELAGAGPPPARLFRPLGLVLETGKWWLVHLAAAGPAVLPLTDLTLPCTYRRRFSRPGDFDLAAFWRLQAAASNPPDPRSERSIPAMDTCAPHGK